MNVIENGQPWSYDPITGLLYRYLRNSSGQWAIQYKSKGPQM